MESRAMLNTLAYAKRLKAAGVPEPQAEVHAEALAEFLGEALASKQDMLDVRHEISEFRTELKHDIAETNQRIDALRTELKLEISEFRTGLKHDIAETNQRIDALRTELKREIGEVRTELKHDIVLLEKRMTIRLGGIMVAGIGMLGVLIAFL